MSERPVLSVVLAVADHQAEAASRTLASLEHPLVQPILALHGRQPLRVEQPPPGCLTLQMGPCDAATARNRGLGAVRAAFCLWLRPGETLSPIAPGVLARALEQGGGDAIFVPLAGTGSAAALRDLGDRLAAGGGQTALATGLWQLPYQGIRAVVSTERMRARHLHFPAGLDHSSLFFDRAVLMLFARVGVLDMPVIAPAPALAPAAPVNWRDLLSVIRALLALFPRTPGFADPALRLTVLASLLGQAIGVRAGLPPAETASHDAALRQIWREQDPRLARLLAPEFCALAPDLPVAMQRALDEARALLAG